MNLSPYEQNARYQALQAFDQIKIINPDDWITTSFSVGNIEAIGFSEKCPHKLICITTEMVSLFDCHSQTFEKLNVDEEPESLSIFIPELDEQISLAGVYGGGLRQISSHTWLDIIAPYYPLKHIILFPPFTPWQQSPDKAIIFSKDFNIIAAGFNKTGEYLAVAETDLIIAKRQRWL